MIFQQDSVVLSTVIQDTTEWYTEYKISLKKHSDTIQIPLAIILPSTIQWYLNGIFCKGACVLACVRACVSMCVCMCFLHHPTSP